MDNSKKNVTIIGGGVAGLTTAIELSQYSIHVDVIEKSPFLGGHGIQYACKATDRCVKCGACVVEEKLKTAAALSSIRLHTESQIEKITQSKTYSVSLLKRPAFINPTKCTNCGICFQRCPADAINRGFSTGNQPLFAISKNKCLYFKDGSCTLCASKCPEDAITLTAAETTESFNSDAIVLATGFQPYNPEKKPYGYHRFVNVITNLELEQMLRRHSVAQRPSDGQAPGKIAFIQCVGSRDAKLNHLWCSKVCCGSALRMARLIRSRQPEIEISFFYIDVQSFGKNFEAFYREAQNEIEMIRSIPADIYPAEDDSLRAIYYDSSTRQSHEPIFDLVILSIGMLPNPDNSQHTEMFGLKSDPFGFWSYESSSALTNGKGVFTVGAANGPMSIAETVIQAEQTAWQVYNDLVIESNNAP